MGACRAKTSKHESEAIGKVHSCTSKVDSWCRLSDIRKVNILMFGSSNGPLTL
jgi:hypothetical protein